MSLSAIWDVISVDHRRSLDHEGLHGMFCDCRQLHLSSAPLNMMLHRRDMTSSEDDFWSVVARMAAVGKIRAICHGNQEKSTFRRDLEGDYRDIQ